MLDIWHPQNLNLVGIGIAFIAAIATVIRLYVFGNQTKSRNPAIVGAEVFLFAAFFALLLPIFSSPVLPTTVVGYGWAVLSCISLVLGTFGMFYGIAILGAFEYSLLCKIEPIFTAIFSAVLIHEYLLWHQYVGMAVVLGSLALYKFGVFRAKRYVIPA